MIKPYFRKIILSALVFFVPFKKVLSFGNKNKIGFILYFPHLIVPLHPQIKKVTIR